MERDERVRSCKTDDLCEEEKEHKRREREREKKKLVTGETRANDGWRSFSISLAAGRPWLKGAIGAQVVGTRACSSGWWRQVGEPLGARYRIRGGAAAIVLQGTEHS